MKPGYKQTEIGVIPEDWDIGSLKEAFLQIDAGTSVNSDEKAKSRYFVLKTSAVRKGHVNIKEAKPVIASDYPRLKCPIKKGSIIISRMNTPSMVGECGFSTVDAPNTFLPDRLWQIEALSAEYDFQWLNYLLNTEKYSAAVRATATGTSNSMKNIAKERLLEIAIPKPRIQEQQHIAEAISDIDELVVSLEKLIEKKKAIKQGTMQQLLTGKIRLPGFIEAWKEVKLKKRCIISRGGSPRPIQDYLTDDSDGIHWIKIGDVDPADKYIVSTREKIKPSGAEKSRSVFKGDLILSNSMSFGRPYFLKINGCIHDGWLAIQEYQDAFDVDFLYYALCAEYIYQQYVQMAAGSSVKNLNKEKVGNLVILYPEDKKEQKAIAAILSDMDGELEVLNKRFSKAQDIKLGMMQQLLTGQIRLIEKGE